MEQLINVIFSVLLIIACTSGVIIVVLFVYPVLSRLFDKIIGVTPTDKEIEEMTK